MENKIKIESVFDLDNKDAKNEWDEKSWVAFIMDESNRMNVKFLNKELFPDEFSSFADFCTYIFEDIGSPEHDYKKTEADNFKSLIAIKSVSDESYDEDLGAVVPVVDCSANLVHIYNGGLSRDDLATIYKSMSKELASIIAGEVDMRQDAAQYSKDPYSYLGINKKGF